MRPGLFRQPCFEAGDNQGYLLLLRQLVTTVGRPIAVYHDRHSIFIPPSQQKLSVEEEWWPLMPPPRCVGHSRPSTFGRSRPISPGERTDRTLFGTLQDRLVTELRLADITTLAEANASWHLSSSGTTSSLGSRHVRRDAPIVPWKQSAMWSRSAASCTTARWEQTHVRLGAHHIQLQPDPGRMSYAKTRVEVQERLDGALAVYFQGQCLATQVAPRGGTGSPCAYRGSSRSTPSRADASRRRSRGCGYVGGPHDAQLPWTIRAVNISMPHASPAPTIPSDSATKRSDGQNHWTIRVTLSLDHNSSRTPASRYLALVVTVLLSSRSTAIQT